MITIIAAKAANNVIGRRNDLPWHFPDDLKRFKSLTDGHPVILGRKTFESILARLKKPLPGRIHFVLTALKSDQYKLRVGDREGLVTELFPGQVVLCNSYGQAVHRAEALDSNVFAIGGERVFESALKDAGKMELTEVHEDYEGDAFFPEFDEKEWFKSSEDHDGYSFVTYKRRFAANGSVH